MQDLQKLNFNGEDLTVFADERIWDPWFVTKEIYSILDDNKAYSIVFDN